MTCIILHLYSYQGNVKNIAFISPLSIFLSTHDNLIHKWTVGIDLLWHLHQSKYSYCMRRSRQTFCMSRSGKLFCMRRSKGTFHTSQVLLHSHFHLSSCTQMDTCRGSFVPWTGPRPGHTPWRCHHVPKCSHTPFFLLHSVSCSRLCSSCSS